jgi:hypothetical protein
LNDLLVQGSKEMLKNLDGVCQRVWISKKELAIAHLEQVEQQK